VATLDKRLDKVEAGLSPQQAVLLWLNEVHQYGTVQAYFASLKDVPIERYPLYRLPEQMKQAVRVGLKDKKLDAVARTERKAVREVVFLFCLVQQFNMRLWGDWRAMCLQLAFVASELKGLLQDDDAKPAEYEQARQRAVDAVLEFIQYDIAIRVVAERYFAGTNPIFPEHARLLSDSLETAELAVTMFNDQLEWLAFLASKTKKRKAPLPAEPIDLDTLKQAITPHGVDLARHIVVMAKVEAARFMGATEEALGILRARLWPEPR
jgi:hypothetical protein